MSTAETVTVSLEWAKKLKEAGWNKHDCYFVLLPNGICRPATDVASFREQFAAPTAEEILRMLPKILENAEGTKEFFLSCGPVRGDNDEWWINYEYEEVGIGAFHSESTLANAAAAMWCYLKENNLLPES